MIAVQLFYSTEILEYIAIQLSGIAGETQRSLKSLAIVSMGRISIQTTNSIVIVIIAIIWQRRKRREQRSKRQYRILLHRRTRRSTVGSNHRIERDKAMLRAIGLACTQGAFQLRGSGELTELRIISEIPSMVRLSVSNCETRSSPTSTVV